jgi:hypothetical protein
MMLAAVAFTLLTQAQTQSLYEAAGEIKHRRSSVKPISVARVIRERAPLHPAKGRSRGSQQPSAPSPAR